MGLPLIHLLSSGESGQLIAGEFSVSRERVRQWKNTFGRVLTLYQVHPDVQMVLDEGQEQVVSAKTHKGLITLL